MVSQTTRLTRIAQAEFTEIRQRSPSKKAFLSSPKLLVLPNRFMAKLGGAAAIYRWTCICPKLLEAPPDVRRGIIAHEWGHVASGHSLATMAALILVLIYATLTATMPGGYFWPLVNISLLSIITALLSWALNPKREFEADAHAAKAVGAQTVADSLRWIVEHIRAGEVNEEMIERLKRLDHESSSNP